MMIIEMSIFWWMSREVYFIAGTLATVGTQEFIINFIFNNSDIFGGISLNPIILRLII